jgi:hypothetical protein
MEEWTSGDTYSNRVNHLLGTLSGGLNQDILVPGTTVLNDSSVDQILGEGDQDFFLIDIQQDIATDIQVGETVIDL